jgi:hypothetical protein
MEPAPVPPYHAGMSFHVLRVQPGTDPDPPAQQRRVLISYTRWGDSPSALTEDERGAIMRYDRSRATGFDHAQDAALDWARRQSFSVENVYIEIDPEA